MNATNVHAADVLSPQIPPRWFTNYMSVYQSNLHSNFQALNKNLLVDKRLQETSTTTVDCSDVTDMKQRPQIDWSVATTTAFSQQPSVCSTVNNAPPVYRTVLHLSTPTPACYPYPNAPSSDKLSVTICITGNL